MGLHKPNESLGQRRVLLCCRNANLAIFAVLDWIIDRGAPFKMFFGTRAIIITIAPNGER